MRASDVTSWWGPWTLQLAKLLCRLRWKYRNLKLAIRLVDSRFPSLSIWEKAIYLTHLGMHARELFSIVRLKLRREIRVCGWWVLRICVTVWWRHVVLLRILLYWLGILLSISRRLTILCLVRICWLGWMHLWHARGVSIHMIMRYIDWVLPRRHDWLISLQILLHLWIQRSIIYGQQKLSIVATGLPMYSIPKIFGVQALIRAFDMVEYTLVAHQSKNQFLLTCSKSFHRALKNLSNCWVWVQYKSNH